MHFEGTAGQVSALYDALLQAQSEFPVIPKTKSAYNYKYAPLPDIQAIIRPVLQKHNLGVFHSINRVDGKVFIGTTVIHKEGGRVSCDGLPIPETAKPQEQGGVVTYGMRYGTCAILGIVPQDDDDAALASGRSRKAKGVAQGGRAPVSSTTGDSGSSPDPNLPNKEERAEYAKKINIYKQYVDLSDIEGYVLSQSGASEARFVTKKQWDTITHRLDATLAIDGPTGLKRLLGVN